MALRIAFGASLQYAPTEGYGVAHGAPKITEPPDTSDSSPAGIPMKVPVGWDPIIVPIDSRVIAISLNLSRACFAFYPGFLLANWMR